MDLENCRDFIIFLTRYTRIRFSIFMKDSPTPPLEHLPSEHLSAADAIAHNDRRDKMPPEPYLSIHRLPHPPAPLIFVLRLSTLLLCMAALLIISSSTPGITVLIQGLICIFGAILSCQAAAYLERIHSGLEKQHDEEISVALRSGPKRISFVTSPPRSTTRLPVTRITFPQDLAHAEENGEENHQNTSLHHMAGRSRGREAEEGRWKVVEEEEVVVPQGDHGVAGQHGCGWGHYQDYAEDREKGRGGGAAWDQGGEDPVLPLPAPTVLPPSFPPSLPPSLPPHNRLSRDKRLTFLLSLSAVLIFVDALWVFSLAGTAFSRPPSFPPSPPASGAPSSLRTRERGRGGEEGILRVVLLCVIGILCLVASGAAVGATLRVRFYGGLRGCEGEVAVEGKEAGNAARHRLSSGSGMKEGGAAAKEKGEGRKQDQEEEEGREDGAEAGGWTVIGIHDGPIPGEERAGDEREEEAREGGREGRQLSSCLQLQAASGPAFPSLPSSLFAGYPFRVPFEGKAAAVEGRPSPAFASNTTATPSAIAAQAALGACGPGKKGKIPSSRLPPPCRQRSFSWEDDAKPAMAPVALVKETSPRDTTNLLYGASEDIREEETLAAPTPLSSHRFPRSADTSTVQEGQDAPGTPTLCPDLALGSLGPKSLRRSSSFVLPTSTTRGALPLHLPPPPRSASFVLAPAPSPGNNQGMRAPTAKRETRGLPLAVAMDARLVMRVPLRT